MSAASSPKRMKLDFDNDTNRLEPILSSDLTENTPLVEVYVGEIEDPRNTSKVILKLNEVLPIPELTHLKRVKLREVLLFPIQTCPEKQVNEYLENKGFDTSWLKNKIRKVFVAEIPPKVRKQYTAVNKLWPCNFHSNKYLEKLSTNTLFTKKEMQDHEKYIEMAIEISKFIQTTSINSYKNGVVIVDPKLNSVVATGSCQVGECPIKHAVMVAIDNVARTQNGGAWNPVDLGCERTEVNLSGVPRDVLRMLKEKFPRANFGSATFLGKSDSEEPSDGPYLCTGYNVYSIVEPCVMCAMALIHSRAKRVFYGIPSSKGGLGTLCKVHTVKDLNHHYEVYRGVLEEQCRKLNVV